MGCPPVRGLFYIQMDKHGIAILFHLHQCRPCTSRDICAKVGKGGIANATPAFKPPKLYIDLFMNIVKFSNR